MTLSCLVISRTSGLLNQLLASLTSSRLFWENADEVLCSWNGDVESELNIQSPGTPSFRIAQRQEYHFASNMNGLARLAQGDLVLLINDDVVLDPGSLDRAIEVLEQHPKAGVVGGLLRTSAGQLGHAGLLFNADHQPYNRCHPELGPLVPLTSPALLESGAIPAVTGALMLLRRADLLAVPLRESFEHCGEDVVLCLDLKRQLGKSAYYASNVTAIHDEKSTRGATNDAADLEAVAAIAGGQLACDSELLNLQGRWLTREASWLTGLALDQYTSTVAAQRQLDALQHDLEQRLAHWQQERHILIAEREDLRQHLLSTWASRSWRLTRPLRLLGRIWRRLLSGF